MSLTTPCYILILFLIFTMTLFPVTNHDQNMTENNARKQLVDEYLNNQEQAQELVDCNRQIRLCGSDNDCTNGCIKNTNSFVCMEQICKINTTIVPPTEDFNCNTKHGIFLLLTANGSFHCVSLLPHFYTNTDKQQKFSCANGVLDIDVSKETPSIKNCQCNPNFKLVINQATPIIPRCIPEKSVDIEEYEYVDELITQEDLDEYNKIKFKSKEEAKVEIINL